MAIPESQLDTWSHQGSITQSSITYNSIKTTLDATDTPYSAKTYKVFLQGSYGNDTNIYSESDVDIVIRLDDCFQHDLSQLPAEQQEAFKTSHSDATYTHQDFKADVLGVLSSKYGNDVDSGEKAIAIAASGNRRKSDVIAAIQYRRYHKFLSNSDQSYDEGICFYTNTGTKSYDNTFVNAINWILEADRTKFLCANEQYYLLFEDSPVTWRAEKCDKFLDAAVDLWKQW